MVPALGVGLWVVFPAALVPLGLTFLSVLVFVSCCSSHLSCALLLGQRVCFVALSVAVLPKEKERAWWPSTGGWMWTLVRMGDSRGLLFTPSLQHFVKIACKCSSRFTAPAASAPGKRVSGWPGRVHQACQIWNCHFCRPQFSEGLLNVVGFQFGKCFLLGMMVPSSYSVGLNASVFLHLFG